MACLGYMQLMYNTEEFHNENAFYLLLKRC